MKKLLAVLLFMISGTFFYGNALALDTYIPQITTGANYWTDYLQVNNNASSTATFTLTLYGSTGAQIYSQSHSVGGRNRSQIELKALNSSAATGKITYTETGLVFRVSYESQDGGVAEFKTIDSLGSNIGFYFSDFSSLVQWKGVAIANMGTTNTNVTFYVLGGGSILQTHTETIAPKAKLVGNNFNLSWLSGLNLSQIESIIAVANSSSLCGIAISGDTVNSRLLFTPAIPVSNFTPPGETSYPLIGNFTFVFYAGPKLFTMRVTLDTRSSSKTSEGTYFYTGYNADYPSETFAAAAWSPSTSKYFMAVSPVTSSPWLEGYVFSIDADNTLPGCYKLSNDYGSTWTDCVPFIIPASHKSPLGSWDMSMESRNAPIDINNVFEKKMAEIQESQAQRTESPSSVDVDFVSKINELKAMIENHR